MFAVNLDSEKEVGQRSNREVHFRFNVKQRIRSNLGVFPQVDSPDFLGVQSQVRMSHYTEESESTLSVLTVPAIQNVFPIQYTVEVNGTPISMEVESGSCYSFLNSDWWNRLARPILRQGPILKDVWRNLIPVLGVSNVEVRLSDQSKQLRIVFLDRPDTASLLGREWIAEFNLLSVHQTQPETVPTSFTSLLTEFSDRFDTSTLPPHQRIQSPPPHQAELQLQAVQTSTCAICSTTQGRG